MLSAATMIRVRCTLPLLLGTLACETTAQIRVVTGDAAIADVAAPGIAPTYDPRGRSYFVEASLELDGPIPPGYFGIKVPPDDAFNVSVDLDGPAGPRIVVSRSGTVATAGLIEGAGKWRTKSALLLGATTFEGTCTAMGRMTYTDMTLAMAGDGVSGTLKGSAELVSRETVGTVLFKGTFIGRPDRDPPRFTFAPARLHAGDRLDVHVSEVLPVGTQARLVGPDGTTVPLRPLGVPEDGPALFTLDGLVGQHSGYRLVITPAARDLAGNEAASLPALNVVAVPFVAEDGFEGSDLPYLEGAAAVVDATRLPPIAGQRSLLLPAGFMTSFMTSDPPRASARLRVSAGQHVVRATVRAIVYAGSSIPLTLIPPMIRAVAPNGSMTPGQMDAPKAPFTVIEGPLALGSPQPLTFALPPGAQDEVLIDFSRPEFCSGLLPPWMGLLIDDLHVE